MSDLPLGPDLTTAEVLPTPAAETLPGDGGQVQVQEPDGACVPSPVASAEASAGDAAQPTDVVTGAAEVESATPEPLTADQAPGTADADGPAEVKEPRMSLEECAQRLADAYPAVFSSQNPQPLKLRIQADLQQRQPGVFSRKLLSAFLHRHTTTTAYLRALVNATSRFDLDGQPAGDIAQEHKDAAQAELDRRKSIREARVQAMREAARAQRAAQRREAHAGMSPQADGTPEAGAAGPQEGGAPSPSAPQTRGRPPRSGPRDANGPNLQRHRPHPARSGEPGGVPGAGRSDAPRSQRPPVQGRPPHGARTDAQPSEAQRNGQRRFDPRRSDAHRPDDRRSAPARFGMPEGRQEDRRGARPAPASELQDAPGWTDQQRRAAKVLRAWESTALKRSNFLALQGLSESEFESLLKQAQADRAQRPGSKEPGGGR